MIRKKIKNFTRRYWNKWLKAKKINLRITKMPLLLVFCGLMGLGVSIWGNEAYRNFFYFLINSLFILIPLSTIKTALVIKKEGKGKNILKRMLITCIPGLIGFLIFSTDFKNYYLFAISFVGALYFILDFVEQGDLAYKVIHKPKLTIKNEEDLFEALATKCSRTVFYESLSHMKDKKLSIELKKRAQRYPFTWINLFPLTKKSLTEKILGIKF